MHLRSFLCQRSSLKGLNQSFHVETLSSVSIPYGLLGTIDATLLALNTASPDPSNEPTQAG